MTCSAQMHTELDASAFAESNADKRYRILDTRSPRDSLRRTQKEIRDSRIENRESSIEHAVLR